MDPSPRHRQPTHRRRRLRLPRWVLVIGALILCVGVGTSVWNLTAWHDVTVLRGIDPAIVEPGTAAEPAADADPTLASAPLIKQERASRVKQVQGEIAPDLSVPAASGEGRRIVYSEGRQRVWLVADDESVESTYLVSGSAHDNLDPGTYAVYSRSEQARSFDGASTMAYFVRFTQGPSGAAIGFHDIPIDLDGEALQTPEDLGEPLSHGCIRQLPEDAITLWEFAPIGTTVVVTQ